jgi:hypothetical protein
MTDSTFEEARRCPVCQTPGKEVVTRRPQELPRGTKIHVFSCENERCSDLGERWIVQTNPDGSIPQPGQKGPKAFERPRESAMIMQAARDELRLMDFMSTHPELTEREARRMLGD